MRAYERVVRDLEKSKLELQEKILELEKFEEVVVGRELKMPVRCTRWYARSMMYKNLAYDLPPCMGRIAKSPVFAWNCRTSLLTTA